MGSTNDVTNSALETGGEKKTPETGGEKKTPGPKPKGHVIAEGKSITSNRGILGPGEKVTAKDFSGKAETKDDLSRGKKALEGFVRSGHIVKV